MPLRYTAPSTTHGGLSDSKVATQGVLPPVCSLDFPCVVNPCSFDVCTCAYLLMSCLWLDSHVSCDVCVYSFLYVRVYCDDMILFHVLCNEFVRKAVLCSYILFIVLMDVRVRLMFFMC